MKIVIIEDEPNAAMDLGNRIKEVSPSADITAFLDSIEKAVQWFSEHEQPDLVFMDIQLGDGNSLLLFEQAPINCPVIFCTAYDQYTLDAFRVNGIAYVLKPVNNEKLKEALDKYQLLKAHYDPAGNMDFVRSFKKNQAYKTSYLVNYKSKMLPIPVSDILFFYVSNDNTFLVTEKDEFLLPKNLETLEQELDPAQFYRVNRQYLVAYRHIKEIEHAAARKLEIILKVPVQEPILVSKERATEFKNWLQNR